jgi:hypothetical protein
MWCIPDDEWTTTFENAIYHLDFLSQSKTSCLDAASIDGLTGEEYFTTTVPFIKLCELQVSLQSIGGLYSQAKSIEMVNNHFQCLLHFKGEYDQDIAIVANHIINTSSD